MQVVIRCIHHDSELTFKRHVLSPGMMATERWFFYAVFYTSYVVNIVILRNRGIIGAYLGRRDNMSLIKCPECGKEISDKASVCIGCGFPISEYVKAQKESLKNKTQDVQPEEPVKNSVEQMTDKYQNVIQHYRNVKCPVCGGIKFDGYGYCESCGHQALFRCPSCGTYNINSAYQCINCKKNFGIIKSAPSIEKKEHREFDDKISSKEAIKVEDTIPNDFIGKIFNVVSRIVVAFFIFMALGTLISHGAKGFPSAITFLLGALIASPLVTKNFPFKGLSVNVTRVVLCGLFFLLAVASLPYADAEEKAESVATDQTADLELYDQAVDDKTELETLESVNDIVEPETAIEQSDANEVATEEAQEGLAENTDISEVETQKIAEEIDYREIVSSKRDNFINDAVSVTYDELRRYPDTYKDKKLKLKIKIKSVEPDGWVFQGDIIATYGGANNEIAISDDRAVREPRFLDGDTITVYALGDGLGTMKVKSTSGIFTKTVDEYEVPCIEVVYTELDNIDSLVTNYIEELNNTEETQAVDSQQSSRRNNNQNSDSESEYYEAGEELGQDLIDAMNGIDHEKNYDDAKEAGRKAAEYLNSLMGSD